MKINIKLMLGSILATMLGLVVALPILVPNLALTKTVHIEVEVVYAYFGVQEINSDIIGLWRNLSDPKESDFRIVSYFFVLNVTNHSSESAIIKEFSALAAQEAQVGSRGEVSAKNVIALGFRDVRGYILFWSQYLHPNESRLIGLTGIVEVPNLEYAVLQSGKTYLFGSVEAQPYSRGSWSRGYSLKHVELQITDGEFMYNAVLSENQILRIDESNGVDIYIETRR
jgi:hypothetical protein